MGAIFDKITEFIKEFLISLITGSLGTMFDDVNTKVGTIAADVGQTPQSWNGSIFNLLHNLSDTVIVPIAGLIITFILCYELITMIMEKNNMHDIDTFMFFKYIFKACVAVYIVTHTFDITMAVFDLGQHIVTQSAGVIGANTSIDISSALTDIEATLSAMGIGELFLLVLETSLVSLCMKILSVCITVVIFGRMIEIYMYCSVGAIPFATMTNREWGQVGNNYLRGLVALSLQGFFIMVCVGIYAVLVNGFTVTTNLHTTIFTVAAYTVVLCITLFKTGSISRSILNAH
ncbi:MAG: CD0415/CD1112 family protein [bacterium]|nr:CD0415/CD1112 family protein [bacterium]